MDAPALPDHRRAVAALAAAAALVHVGPAVWSPTRQAIGGAGTEAPSHLWGLWTTTSGLSTHGPWWRSAPDIGWPGGFDGHLIDPSSLLVFAPVMGIIGGPQGATLAWNLLVACGAALAAVGGAQLVRAVVPHASESSVLLGATASAFTPFALAFPWLGRTEYLTLSLLPLQLALLWTATQTPHGGGLRRALGSGLCLGLVGANLGYGGIFAAMVNIPVAGMALRAASHRRVALQRLAVVAGMSLAVAAPSVVALFADPGVATKLRPYGQVHHTEALCALLRLCAPEGLTWRMDAPPYVGVVLPLLAVMGGIRNPRAVVPWLGLAAGLFAFALGPGANHTRPAAWLVAVIPPLAAVQDWSRLAGVVPALLAIPAAFALRGVPRWAVALLALGVVLDTTTWPRSRLSTEVPTFSVAPPPGLATAIAALPPGPIIPLPIEGKSRDVWPPEVGFHALWQPAHGRPISARADTEADSAYSQSGLLQRTALPEDRLAHLPQTHQLDCIVADARALSTAGYAGIVLTYPERHSALAAWLLAVLGPPAAEAPSAWSWTLPTGEPAEWCAMQTRRHRRQP